MAKGPPDNIPITSLLSRLGLRLIRTPNLTPAADQALQFFQLCGSDSFVLQQVLQELGSRSSEITVQEGMYRKAMYLLASHPGLKDEGSAPDAVTYQFLVLHQPQEGLDSLVVGRRIFLGVKQQIINGGLL